MYWLNSSASCIVVSTTHRIPAFCAASTPLGASSNTIQFSAATPINSAALANVSGCGLLIATSSALTIALKYWCKCKLIGNNGVLNGSVNVNNTTAYAFRPTTPATYANFVPNPGVPAASYNIATSQEDYRFPQVFRSNLAVDFKIYQDIIGSVEGLFTQSISNNYYYNANLKPSVTNFTGPDTRPRFAGGTATRINASNPTITDATVLKSGAYGGSFNGTVKIEKPVKSKGLGWMVAYNFSSAKDYLSAGSIASSSWTGMRSVNGNNRPDLAFSDNDIRNRWITNINYRFELGKTAALQVSLFGQIQNQGRFSYTYSGDMNGDNVTGNDLIYVPRNQSEMNFVANGAITVQQQKDAFDAYINQDEYLSKRRGQYAERNGALQPTLARFDLSVKLELFRNIGGNRNTIQLTGDIFNIGNMLNPKYGVADVINNSSPLGINAVDVNGVPSFRMNTATVNGVTGIN